MAKKKTSPTPSTPDTANAPAPRRRTPTTSAPPARDMAADAAAGAPSNPTYEQIAEAAYQRYLSRGGGHGRDFDDWLEAERELRSRR